ncbi:MAG: carbohydrate kinase [Chitinophagaceae bacterium]|nr:carbohydrate kinase [Chitinophagaceae bacterium]
MLLLGIDLGTSSVKVSIVDGRTGHCICSTYYPEQEAEIESPYPGWAEQSPDKWWDHCRQAIKKLHSTRQYDPKNIRALGIAYQMHGLVMLDKQGNSLRNSIIWCDSRAVPYGEKAFQSLGTDYCLHHLLNSPGNFTASKLAWVKENEPDIFAKADKIMLPGDFISFKLTGEISSSISALSEGIFWDFKTRSVSGELLTHFGFDPSLLPQIKNVFSVHGLLQKQAALELGLEPGIPISYKAGDQPNNAFSLNILEPGEVAANAGTSGVIYAVTETPETDPLSRVNQFAHVNYSNELERIGVLLCINGAGISNKWIRSLAGDQFSYEVLNQKAAAIPAGADGLSFLPFGNGSERMLENKYTGASFQGIDLNKHTIGHLYRAGLEGVAFAFRYGLDIMRNCGLQPSLIKANHANMFLSAVFTNSFVNATGIPVELYQSDGSRGAALGAGIGAGLLTLKEAFAGFNPVRRIEPDNISKYTDLYEQWSSQLKSNLSAIK